MAFAYNAKKKCDEVGDKVNKFCTKICIYQKKVLTLHRI